MKRDQVQSLISLAPLIALLGLYQNCTFSMQLLEDAEVNPSSKSSAPSSDAGGGASAADGNSTNPSSDPSISPSRAPIEWLPSDTEIQNAGYACGNILTQQVAMKGVAPDPLAQDFLRSAYSGALSLDSVRNLSLTSFTGILDVKRAETVAITSLKGSASVATRSFNINQYIAGNASDQLLVNAVDFGSLTTAQGDVTIVAEQVQGFNAINGSLCLNAGNIGSLGTVQGAAVLYGRPIDLARPTIVSIGTVNGVLIINNFDVGSIYAATGADKKIVLIDSTVGYIANFTGTIYSRNSSIQSGALLSQKVRF